MYRERRLLCENWVSWDSGASSLSLKTCGPIRGFEVNDEIDHGHGRRCSLKLFKLCLESAYDPNGEVCQPREPLQRPDLADDHTGQSKDQHADDEAEAGPRAIDLGDLGDGLAVEKYEESDDHEELDRLGDVDEVTRPGAEAAEEEVGVVSDWVSHGVEAEEHLPEDPPRAELFLVHQRGMKFPRGLLCGEDTEDKV